MHLPYHTREFKKKWCTRFKRAVLLFMLFAVTSLTYAYNDINELAKRYGEMLGLTVNDVVKNIHARHPNSKLTQAHVLAVMCQELPSLNPGKLNSEGRLEGLTQVIDSTFRGLINGSMAGGACRYIATLENGECGRPEGRINNPRCSIELGACLFDHLLSRCNGDVVCAYNAYNTGSPYRRANGLSDFVAGYNAFISGGICKKASARLGVWQSMVKTIHDITGGVYKPENIIAELIPHSQYMDEFSPTMYQSQPQQSFWQRIFNFGQGSQGYENSSSYNSSSQQVQKTSTASKNSYNNQVLSPSDIFTNSNNSSTNASITSISNKENSFDIDGTENNTESVLQSSSSNGHLRCFPKTVELGEPYIVAYECPAGYSLSKTDIPGASGSAFLTLLSADKKDTQMSLTCQGQNEKIHFSCSVSVIEPMIETFSVEPANPKPGDTIRIFWSAKDVKTCLVSNKDGSFKRTGKRGEAYLKYTKGDTLAILCQSKTLKNIKKEISI